MQFGVQNHKPRKMLKQCDSNCEIKQKRYKTCIKFTSSPIAGLRKRLDAAFIEQTGAELIARKLTAAAEPQKSSIFRLARFHRNRSPIGIDDELSPSFALVFSYKFEGN